MSFKGLSLIIVPGEFGWADRLSFFPQSLGIKDYSDWPTIPQLYLDKDFVGGCDILVSMHQNGDLAKMLEEKGVLVAAD